MLATRYPGSKRQSAQAARGILPMLAPRYPGSKRQSAQAARGTLRMLAPRYPCSKTHSAHAPWFLPGRSQGGAEGRPAGRRAGGTAGQPDTLHRGSHEVPSRHFTTFRLKIPPSGHRPESSVKHIHFSLGDFCQNRKSHTFSRKVRDG